MPKTKRAKINASKLFLVFAVALGLIAVGFGALLSYYGKVVGTVKVTQAVIVDGKPCYNEEGGAQSCEIEETVVNSAGSYIYTQHEILNNATDTNITVSITGNEPQESGVTAVNVTYALVEKQASEKSVNCENQNYSDSLTQTLEAGKTYVLCIRYYPDVRVVGKYTVTTTISYSG